MSDIPNFTENKNQGIGFPEMSQTLDIEIVLKNIESDDSRRAFALSRPSNHY